MQVKTPKREESVTQTSKQLSAIFKKLNIISKQLFKIRHNEFKYGKN